MIQRRILVLGFLAGVTLVALVSFFLWYTTFLIPAEEFFEKSLPLLQAGKKSQPLPGSFDYKSLYNITRKNKPSEKSSYPSSAKLNLRLAGIVLWGKKSSAVIEDFAAGTQGFYHLGDTIKGFRITKILMDSVTLSRKNQELVLMLTAGSPASSSEIFARKIDDRSWKLSTDAIGDIIRNIDQHAGEVMIYQQYQGGTPSGLKIHHLVKGNDIEKLGIESGDIVKKINGLDTNDISDVLAAAYKLSNDTDFQVDIERNKQIITLNYQLDKSANFLVPIISRLLNFSKNKETSGK